LTFLFNQELEKIEKNNKKLYFPEEPEKLQINEKLKKAFE